MTPIYMQLDPETLHIIRTLSFELVLVIALLIVVIAKLTSLRRFEMSKSAELKAATDALTTSVNNAIQNATINATPDTDVTAGIGAINSAKAALDAAFPAPATPTT